MHFLHNAMIRDHYDVVIVGAGIGGLTTAALLAKKGIKVLAVEQHYMPGGCCAAIRRQDISMDVGATVLYGFGEKGYNTHRFVMNELEEEIDMIPREAIYHMHISDFKITFWMEFEPFFKELVDLFPNQEKELRKFYDDLFKLYEDALLKSKSVVPPTEMSLKGNMKTFLGSPAGMIQLSRMMFKSGEDIFKKYFTDPKIIAFFDMLTRTFSYVDANECPALLSATMFVDNHVGGAYYPAGSPQMLSNKLEKAIERFGGQILYKHLVDEILISGGKAYGIRLADGTEIMADRVVSDASIWNLYGKLVKSRHVDPRRMKWAHDFIPTHANMILYIGVDTKAIPEDAKPMEIIIEDMYDMAGHGVTIYIPSLQDPSVSPPGTCSVTITAVSTIDWPRPWDPEYQSEDYKRMKEEEADKLLDRVEKRFPDFKKHIKVMEIATPTTTERYTLKNWGNVGGPKQMIGQDMMKRARARSDWKNLYLCGDSTVMGLGVLPATISAVGAANMVLQDMGLEEYEHRPFSRQYVNLVKARPWTPAPDPSEPITEASARRMARECQHCEEPGCLKVCPASIDLVGFHRRIEAGNFAGAARSMREMNPLAEVCGAICPAEQFCEKECNRLDFDNKTVRIRELHGWACGHVSRLEGWDRFITARKEQKVAVVGAGPAGLACAHYLARLGYRADVLDRAEKPGGMLSHAIPAFRLSDGILNRDIEGLTFPGMHFKFGKALGKDFSVADLKKDYDAVFLAPGLWSGRSLEIPGLDKSRTTDALTFLKEYRKTGKTGAGKRVLVIGGGSVAADAAMVAKECGAGEVTMVCLEKAEEMPALAGEVAELKRAGVKILNGRGPKAVETDSKMSFIRCTSVFDDQGKFSPSYDESETMEVKFDQVILAVGQGVEPALGKYLKKEFKRDDMIEVEPETMQVKGRAGVYAGGDIVRGAGTVVEAVGDGRRAAMAMDAYLKK